VRCGILDGSHNFAFPFAMASTGMLDSRFVLTLILSFSPARLCFEETSLQ